jgi:uncharacterized membrane protein YeaQ/YmgE (transglycosylase-associated protein family)
MTIESLVIILVIGGVAGWLAGLLFHGSGFGLALNILLGVAGGFVGTWLLGALDLSMPGGPIVSAILTASLGAAALLGAGLVLRRVLWAERRGR